MSYVGARAGLQHIILAGLHTWGRARYRLWLCMPPSSKVPPVLSRPPPSPLP